MRKVNVKIHMFSTRMDGKCGIGAHAKYLRDEQKKLGLDIIATFVEPQRKNPLYYLKTAMTVSKDCDIAHIEFEYSFFGKLGPFSGIYVPLFYTFLRLLSYALLFKIATTIHEIWEPENPPRFGELGAIYINIVNRFVFNLSDFLIVFSEVTKDKVARQGVEKSRIVVTPQGCNSPIFMDKNECKKKIGLDPNKKIVTIFGFIRRSKGHDLLIEASKHLKNTIVLIAGDIRSQEESKGYLEELRRTATDETLFTGFVEEDNIPVILNATDVMVLPYRRIAESAVLDWSLAYRIPTITSDLPYFREINEKYSCTLLFRNQDIVSLVDSINKLLNDKELQNRLRSVCKKFQNENSFERAAKETYMAYLACLRKTL